MAVEAVVVGPKVVLKDGIMFGVVKQIIKEVGVVMEVLLLAYLNMKHYYLYSTEIKYNIF